jgi:prophage CP4-57 regulatory protein (alpA)
MFFVVTNSTFLMEIPAMSDRWLSVEEIDEYLGVSKDTV